MNTADLSVLIRSRVPILVLSSIDEAQAIKAIMRATGNSVAAGTIDTTEARKPTGTLPVFQWTATDGLKRLDVALPPQRTATDPTDALKHIRANNMPAVYIL